MNPQNQRRTFAFAAASIVALAGAAHGQAPQPRVDKLDYFSLDAYEAKTGKKVSAFKQAPMLDADVASGALPPVEKRLPLREDIQVVVPRDSIGRYGGTISYNATNPNSFGNIGWSAQDVHLTGLTTNWEEVFPDLAKSVELSADNTVATVKLRRGLRWSDGAPLTADDIMFWYKDIATNPELPPMPAPFIVGGKPVTVAKVDDATVTFTFAAPNPGFVLTTARIDPGFPIAPMHYLKKWHKTYNPDADAVARNENFRSWTDAFIAHVNGQTQDMQIDPNLPVAKPWMMQSIDRFGNVFYSRNPYFWKVDSEGNQLPYIDKQVRMLISDMEVVKLNVQAGKLDYADKFAIADLPVLRAGEKGGGYTTMLYAADLGAIRKYQFNLTVSDPALRQIFNDVRFRQAMSLAVNRDEINQTIYFGLGVPRQWGVSSKSPFFEEWEADHFSAYDPAKAGAILDEMGLKKGPGGMRLRPDGQPLKIILSDAIGSTALSELVAEYWRKVGVDTQLNTTTRENFAQALKAGEIQASVWFADVVSEKDMYSRPIWLRPPYGLDTNPVGGGLAWREWWLSKGQRGAEPPEVYRKQMELVDAWQSTRVGSPDYYKLGKQTVAETVRQMMHIGTVGEVPYVYTRSNRLKNFPNEKMLFIDHFTSAQSAQWYLDN
jgi:peptide/nickel transport system substrate-binding protein